MELTAATDIFSALGHEGRLRVFRLLARRAPQALRPSEIAEICEMKRNTLSAHLAVLAKAGLIAARRDGTALFYHLVPATTQAFTQYLLGECCRGRPDLCAPALHPMAEPAIKARADEVKSVLFICTGNSCRSIIAETLLRELGKGRFAAYSAGTRPAETVNRAAQDLLHRNGHDISGLRAKDLSEMQGPGAPVFDFVFTVCDQAANEECPAWPGQPISAHWGLPDPTNAEGSAAEVALAYADAYRTLYTRIAAFAELPVETLDRMSLQSAADRIGQLPAEE